jgi:oligopeptide/dipeptide ABC transporter ATP-binding protein
MFRNNKSISIYAVRGISFHINKGEVLGVVGESGSGKSVSCSAIEGLLPENTSATGNIFYDGVDLLELFNKGNNEKLRKYRGKKISYIFQEPGRSFDQLQNMFSAFYETFKNLNPDITKAEAEEKAVKLLTETGIDNARDRLKNFPHQFSGGQLQRIGIALALAQDCELLIADEPTTALDVTIQSQIVSLLLKLKQTRNISIIFISHNIDLVSQISDRIMVMYGGRIMESGETEKIIQTPQNPYTKALLSAAPEFGQHYLKNLLVPIPGKVTDPANPEKGCPFAPRCLFAMEKCKTQMPVLQSASDKTHMSSCFYTEETK